MKKYTFLTLALIFSILMLSSINKINASTQPETFDFTCENAECAQSAQDSLNAIRNAIADGVPIRTLVVQGITIVSEWIVNNQVVDFWDRDDEDQWVVFFDYNGNQLISIFFDHDYGVYVSDANFVIKSQPSSSNFIQVSSMTPQGKTYVHLVFEVQQAAEVVVEQWDADLINQRVRVTLSNGHTFDNATVFEVVKLWSEMGVHVVSLTRNDDNNNVSALLSNGVTQTSFSTFYNSFYNFAFNEGFESCPTSDHCENFEVTLTWVQTLFGFIAFLFSVQLLPGLRVGMLVAIPIVLGVVFFFLKFIRG